MKKGLTGVLLLAVLLSAFTGCGKTATKDGITTNSAFAAEKMYTVSGEKVAIQGNEAIFVSQEMGLALLLPDVWVSLAKTNLTFTASSPHELYCDFLPTDIHQEIQSFDQASATEEESIAFFTKAYDKLFHFLCIYRVNESEADSTRLGEEVARQYENNIELAKNGQDTYFAAYNTTLSENTLSEQDTTTLNTLLSGIETLKQNLILFPPTEATSESSFAGSMTQFSTQDVDGNPITQDIFEDYDLTMVNIWTTWCGFCLEELPELQKLHGALPANMNMITLCCDAADDPELTKEILSSVGATFTTLESNDLLQEQLLQFISGYPTTIFVDKTGKVVGDPQVGAPGKHGALVEAYLDLMNQNLAKIQKAA